MILLLDLECSEIKDYLSKEGVDFRVIGFNEQRVFGEDDILVIPDNSGVNLVGKAMYPMYKTPPPIFPSADQRLTYFIQYHLDWYKKKKVVIFAENYSAMALYEYLGGKFMWDEEGNLSLIDNTDIADFTSGPGYWSYDSGLIKGYSRLDYSLLTKRRPKGPPMVGAMVLST